MTRHLPVQLADSVLLLCMLVPFGANLRAQSNEVLGEIELVGATKVEKTSGVWVDGQYLGYLKELNGSKKILLLPGQHEIVIRQDGYQDFTSKVTVRPGDAFGNLTRPHRGRLIWPHLRHKNPFPPA